MIAHLSGTILSKRTGFAIVDVNGIGYRVYATNNVLASLVVGSISTLLTHLAVRENALDLYGFLSEEELSLFELLITISGIGPKSALAILTIAEPSTLRMAVSAGDSSHLTKVSGIGRKTAEKIILELRDKIGSISLPEETEALAYETEALDALCSLGYSQREVREILRILPKELAGTRERVKEALKLLSTR